MALAANGVAGGDRLGGIRGGQLLNQLGDLVTEFEDEVGILEALDDLADEHGFLLGLEFLEEVLG